MPASTNKLVASAKANAKSIATPFALAGAVALGATLFVGHAGVHAASAAAGPVSEQSVNALTALDQAMEAVASRVSPAVVNVAVTSRGNAEEQASDEQNQGQMQGLPPGLQQFFGQGGGMPQGRPQKPQLEHGVGSGIIISPDGYIVTNNHVVDGATQIKVTLNDRRILTGKVIGVDKLNDLAVIKVAATNLPAIAWGDSTALHPGQTVLAFGSPFGYFRDSVTRGIVSAVNRPNPYSDDARKPGAYIQTDAAINPGNSGGALVNGHGELVGINTFIISNSGSFAGAGFAIPSQLAQSVTAQLIHSGTVHHGYLGVSIEDVTPANAGFFKLNEAEGAIISQVTPDSPAGNAGLRNGDVVIGINGQKVINSSSLQSTVAEDTPGTKLSLEVLRDGARQTINVTVGEFNAKATEEASADGSTGAPAKPSKLGLAVSNLTQDVRQQLRLPENLTGVAVQSVRPASPAEDAALAPGDVILEVNRKPVTSADQFVNQVHASPSDKDLLLLVWSRGNASYRILHTDDSKG